MFFKHVLGPLVILVRLMPVLLSTPVRGDLCPNFPISNPAIVTHINATSGMQHCCKRILCPAGTEVRYCSLHNPNDTSCRPCPHGYYNADAQHSDQNPTCHLWKRCASKLGKVFNEDGTNIFEGTCHCNVALGHFANKWGDCQKRSETCHPDHELHEKSGECVPCRLGHHQPVTGYGPCLPCPIGTHRSNHAQLNCTACPVGRYTVNAGQHRCSTCQELMQSNESDLPCDPKRVPKNPKTDASTDNISRSGGAVWKVLGPVLCAAVLSVLLVAAFLVYRRRQGRSQPGDVTRKSPEHDPQSAKPGYRAVSSSSTASSDATSRSSAEDALEVEKIKANNLMNQGLSPNSEKPGLPADHINTDAPAPQADPPAPAPGQQDPERLVIVNPHNCNITLGHRNQLSMTPAPPPAIPAVSPTAEEHNLNNLNTPRSRQSAPPMLDRGGLGGYSNGMAPAYYDDEAERLAVLYNGPHNC